jgi:dihydrofolate synthase/folylpolyglutamate synthase
MTGQEAIAYIHSFHWLGSKPGLSRTQALLDAMGNPERALCFVHIVGTNGKGSTAAMLASVLQRAGYKMGLYTSPYLQRFHERIRVDDEEIPDEELGAITAFVAQKADALADHPTEFELVTCIALEFYRRRGCDIVVLEAGLGGRLDSTNVIPSPEVVLITNIGLDHTAQLGNTIRAIAAEKAAVIKTGPVVLYRQSSDVHCVVEQVCQSKGVALRVADFDAICLRRNDRSGQIFDWKEYTGLRISLLGAHQRNNAAVVLECVQVLRTRGWRIDAAAVAAGLAAARWPGRFEVLGRDPWFVEDVWHNPQCAETVVDNLCTYFPGQQAVILLGVLEDKDYAGLCDIIAPLAVRFVVVTPPNPRAFPGADLGEFLKRYHKPVCVCADIQEGVAEARRLAGQAGLVCAFGSLYLTGQVRACFGCF